jgi:hypothetical protein
MKLEKLDLPFFEASAACLKLEYARVDEVFFSEPTDRAAFKEAKTYCDPCPSRDKCLAYAMSHPGLEGIWAGTSKRMRERMRTKLRKTSDAVQ